MVCIGVKDGAGESQREKPGLMMMTYHHRGTEEAERKQLQVGFFALGDGRENQLQRLGQYLYESHDALQGVHR